MTSNSEFKAIADLDLDPIKVKLMHRESGEGWSLEQANAVEFEYRRFLLLMKLFPHEQTAPLVNVDVFWHYHILDTRKYAIDCEQIFGYFLHHFPYIGLRGEDDAAAHHRVGARMQELYEATFGQPYIRQGHVSTTETVVIQARNDGTYSVRPGLQTAVTAYCSQEAKAAYCSQETKAAYCSQEAKAAYCSQEAKVAYCSQEAKAAYCSQEAKAAYCSQEAKTAHRSYAQSANDCFYSVRPVLAQAA